MGVPGDFLVRQNHPNPFNPRTEISYSLPRESSVTATVYDLLGRPIKTLFRGRQSPGEHRLQWDAGQNPSGIYIYRIEAGGMSAAGKMLLLR
jgi:hypothetical protein